MITGFISYFSFLGRLVKIDIMPHCYSVRQESEIIVNTASIIFRIKKLKKNPTNIVMKRSSVFISRCTYYVMIYVSAVFFGNLIEPYGLRPAARYRSKNQWNRRNPLHFVRTRTTFECYV